MLHIPQESTLGLLLLNNFINILFIEKSDIYNFADDNRLFFCGNNLSVILKSLEHDMKNLLRWFNSNSLKADPGKFQWWFLGNFYGQNIVLQ